jgi:hypothetical protein
VTRLVQSRNFNNVLHLFFWVLLKVLGHLRLSGRRYSCGGIFLRTSLSSDGTGNSVLWLSNLYSMYFTASCGTRVRGATRWQDAHVSS